MHINHHLFYILLTHLRGKLEREIPFKITLDNTKYLGIYLPRQTEEMPAQRVKKGFQAWVV